jgi:hypothetical protein
VEQRTIVKVPPHFVINLVNACISYDCFIKLISAGLFPVILLSLIFRFILFFFKLKNPKVFYLTRSVTGKFVCSIFIIPFFLLVDFLPPDL